VSFDSKCSKATQEVEGHRYQSNLEYQLAAQHPHHNLRAPTILSIATDFLSTSPHTPRVEEPNPANLCRTWNSTDDSMSSTGTENYAQNTLHTVSNPKQQLPKSVSTEVLHVTRMRCKYTRILLGCTANTLRPTYTCPQSVKAAARAYQGQRNVHIKMHKAVSVAKYERRCRMHM
jgi:hypothetical protein